MVRDYLNTLKTAGGYTWTEIANMSGIPEPTVRKVFSGETADPRFDTIVKLITAMGGDISEAVTPGKKKEIEISSTIAMKETYDTRAEIQQDYITSLKKDKKILAIATAVLVGVVVLLLIFDVVIASSGWIQY